MIRHRAPRLGLECPRILEDEMEAPDDHDDDDEHQCPWLYGSVHKSGPEDTRRQRILGTGWGQATAAVIRTHSN